MNVSTKADEFFSEKRKPILLLLVSEGKYFLSHRLSLALAAKEAGYEVIVATSNPGELASVRSMFQIVSIPFERSIGGVFEELRVLAKIKECINQNEPAIVHAVSLKISILAALCMRSAKSSVLLCAFTGLGYIFTSNKIAAKVLKFVVTLLLRTLISNRRYWGVVQNKEDLEFLQKIKGGCSNRLLLIRGSGVDVDFFSYSDLPQEKISRVLFPARLLADKGIHEFVNAARHILSQRSDVEFLLAGGLDLSNPSAVSRSDIESWTEEGIVNWLGEVQDMRSLYRRSNIICLPSYREGLPKSLLEAASSGRPVVAADVPGCREICRDGENGFLVPVKDATTLAVVLQKLLDDFELCGQLGQRGRKIVENEFSDRIINSLFLDIYKRMQIG